MFTQDVFNYMPSKLLHFISARCTKKCNTAQKYAALPTFQLILNITCYYFAAIADGITWRNFQFCKEREMEREIGKYEYMQNKS